jgi:predicted transglutaminase-like cysteine proteinase
VTSPGRAFVESWWLGLLALALFADAVLARAYDPDRMQRAAERTGQRAVAALPALRALLAPPTALHDVTRLGAVNGFFNSRIAFVDDVQAWGQTDYWASPLESLDKGYGDCEDYAIAKYFSLLAQGVPAQHLRLVYVRAKTGTRSQAHMVVAFYAKAAEEPLIIDNLVATVLPASLRPDLTPVFSFNTEGLWSGVGPQSAGDPQARLSRWREVVGKAKAEGFD